jgi:chemotaxis protein MotB
MRNVELHSLAADQPVPARRKRRRLVEPANHERWLISYADFVTLLFAFFVTMYAISRVDAQKLSAMVESMQVAFTPGAASAAKVIAVLPGTAAAGKPAVMSGNLGLKELRARLAAQLAAQGVQDWVDLDIDERGLVVSIRDVGAFSVGSADLSIDARALLRNIGTVLAGLDNQIRIEGHTDDVPIHTSRFGSNWQLSTNRATTVIAFLLENTKLQPWRVSAAGYAEYRPRVPNTSEAGRLLNRRVDLVVLNPTTQSIEEPRTRPQHAPR